MIPSPTIWQFQYKNPVSHLLQENSFSILQENGFRLVLEQTGSTVSLWTNQTEH